MWADRRTDRNYATKSFHDFVNVPKKVSSSTNRPWRPTAQGEVSSTLSITSALHHWGRWSMSHFSCFTPGNDPVPTVQEAGLVPRPIWKGVENLDPTGIRSPDLPAPCKCLYQIQYPSPLYTQWQTNNYVRQHQQNAQNYIHIYHFTIKTLKTPMPTCFDPLQVISK